MIKARHFHSIIAAASSLAAITIAAPAMAADLGGDCCADLEERVAELEATAARKGNRKVSLTVSGQVSTAVMYFDDGGETNAYVVDNDNSSSRFRFLGSAKITSDVSAGFLIEMDTQLADTNLVTQLTDEGISTTGVSIRHSSWYLDSKRLGRLTVGQTSPATDDIILSDASGCGIACYSDILFGNALFFRRSTDNALTNVQINTFHGGSLDTARGNFVRYDSPVFMGAKIVAAWGEDDFWDVALWYANKIGDFKIVGGVGYNQNTDNFAGVSIAKGQSVDEIKGSISVLHEPSGLFGTFMYVNRDFAAANQGELDYFYFNGGIVAQKLVPLGKTVFYGEYGNGERDAGAVQPSLGTTPAGAVVNVIGGGLGDIDLDVWGFGIVQHISAAEMEFFALYKRYELDTRDGLGVNIPLDDIDIVMTGARIKF